MIILPNIVSTLQLVTTTTANTLYVIDWNDLNTTLTQAFMGTNTGSIVTATTTTLAGSPAASTERTIRQLIIKNVGGANSTQNVTPQKFDGTRAWDLFATVTLSANQSLQYNEYEGWSVMDATGLPLAGTGILGNYEADVQVNGTLLLANSILNFTKSPTLNANASLFGPTISNISYDANVTAIVGPTAAAINTALAAINTALGTINSSALANATTYANGTLVLDTANNNFNNTTMINVYASANGTSQANIALNVNASAVLHGVISGNSSNIAVTYLANGNVSLDFGSGIANGTVINQETFNVAIANQTVFSLSNPQAFNPNYIFVFRNGIQQTPNVHYTYTSNVITFSSNTTLGDEISVREFQTINVVANFATTMITFTANATQNQTVFTLTTNVANATFAMVTKNGLVEVPGQDYTIANNVLTFTSNCNVNDRVEARLFPTIAMGGGGGTTVYANGVLVVPTGTLNFNNSASGFWQIQANGAQANIAFTTNTTVITTYQAVATVNQSSFTLSSNCPGGSNYAIVGVNGVIQEPGTHYSISGNTNLQFTSNLISGDVVEARIFGIWTGGSQGTSRVLQQNINLGVAGANPTGGPLSTFFVIPGVCNFGLVSQFTIVTNAAATYDIWVTSASGNLGNVMLGGSVYQSNTYNISSPWYYEADSTANSDTNMYITINNYTAGVNLNVNVAILRVSKFG